MARKVTLTNQFKRDIKKIATELSMPQWIDAMYCLINDLVLPEKYRDHALTGDMAEYRDCHIKPDLLLIYQKLGDDDLILHRLTTHSELKF